MPVPVVCLGDVLGSETRQIGVMYNEAVSWRESDNFRGASITHSICCVPSSVPESGSDPTNALGM